MIVETGTGSPTATSYSSVAFADAYHTKNKRTSVVWLALSTAQKEYRLETATEIIDRECYFEGLPVKAMPSGQSLQWPRYGLYDRNGLAIDASPLPVDLQKACAELAYRLEEKDLDKEPTRGVISFSAGQGAFSTTLDPNRDPKVLIRSVWNYLRPFLANGGTAALGKAVR